MVFVVLGLVVGVPCLSFAVRCVKCVVCVGGSLWFTVWRSLCIFGLLDVQSVLFDVR